MMVPQVFGFQNITQWGGMYVDGWCGATLYDGDSVVKNWTQTKYMTAGTVGTVFSVPMFTQDMCAHWSRKFCGQITPEGWTVGWVDPYYHGEYFHLPQNVCTSLSDVSWYPHAN